MGFLGGEPPQAGRLARICSVPFLLYGISRLTLEMTSVFVWVIMLLLINRRAPRGKAFYPLVL